MWISLGSPLPFLSGCVLFVFVVVLLSWAIRRFLCLVIDYNVDDGEQRDEEKDEVWKVQVFVTKALVVIALVAGAILAMTGGIGIMPRTENVQGTIQVDPGAAGVLSQPSTPGLDKLRALQEAKDARDVQKESMESLDEFRAKFNKEHAGRKDAPDLRSKPEAE